MTRLGLCLALGLAWASPVRAQTATPADAEPARRVEFLSRVAVRLSGEHLSGDDPRFVWDTNVGAELDMLDYRVGRATFVTNYQAVLGEQVGSFDPNQGNYILGGSTSLRSRGVEVAAVFYHQSRHLSDRPKRGAVDWNMAGGRVSHVWARGERRLLARADLRGTILKTFVDYNWELDTAVRADGPVAPRVGIFAGGGVRLLGVDGTRNRGTQFGFRGEGGVRIMGRAGAAELFLAVERRIDPYPLELSTAQWVSTGFRLTSR